MDTAFGGKLTSLCFRQVSRVEFPRLGGTMELRKEKEREFSNRFRGDHEGINFGNQKFYSIVRRSRAYVQSWLQARCRDKKVLDYGCGDGMFTVWLAKNGADATGIDISSVSFEEAKKIAVSEGVDSRVHFYEMDCEKLNFPDRSFDLIIEGGVLHHLVLERALAEMARVLKEDGAIICGEGLADNPLIQFYRRKTPRWRTEWEVDHILHVRDLEVAKRYFDRIHVEFFHLFTILATPFRNTLLFKPLLTALEAIDSVILKIPFIRHQAWQMVFTLAQPKKIEQSRAC